MSDALKDKAHKIKLLLTDCDGVLTDGCVYYSENGEELKKFSLRDGMGVERLRNLCGIDSGILTRENSEIVRRRGEKLKMQHLYLGVRDKKEKLVEIMDKHKLLAHEIAYIGDDTNDIEVLEAAGLSACPVDAFEPVKKSVHYICKAAGGAGAFRELAELIIYLRNENPNP
jgi:3-deoxy-D-manno-octulosonate 8-phosphate phosphatase (KDO 8-P phosphatase)